MTAPNSFSGCAIATYLAANIPDTTTMSFAVVSSSSWVETVGDHTGQPLGTSGNFVITLDYGLPTEEKVLCSNLNTLTNTVTIVERGYDSTPKSSHIASSSHPVIHTYSADVPQQANLGVANAATAQSTANTANSTANTALANAATAQTTANTAQSTATAAQTSAYGKNLTAQTPLAGTNPTYPATLINYTFSTALSLAAGSGIISFPSTFAHSVLGVNVSVVASASGTGVTQGATVQVVDGTTQLYSCNIKCLDATGAGITGSVRFMVTVCGY